MSRYVPAGRYCTITEYAESMGLSVQSIRKAIASGRLSGSFRVGREVLIPDNAILEYRNVKHGAYIGMKAFQKAQKKRKMDEQDGAALRSYKDAKKRFYGKTDYD